MNNNSWEHKGDDSAKASHTQDQGDTRAAVAFAAVAALEAQERLSEEPEVTTDAEVLRSLMPEIEKMKKDDMECGCCIEERCGCLVDDFNKAITEVIKLIQSRSEQGGNHASAKASSDMPDVTRNHAGKWHYENCDFPDVDHAVCNCPSRLKPAISEPTVISGKEAYQRSNEQASKDEKQRNEWLQGELEAISEERSDESLASYRAGAEAVINDIPDNIPVVSRDEIEDGIDTEDLKDSLRSKYLNN